MKKIIVSVLTLSVTLCLYGPVYGQTPTPAPVTAQEWWDWCMAHPQVIYRVNKRYSVTTEAGAHIRAYEELCFIPGPPSLTPAGSYLRRKEYIEIRDSEGVLRGLANQGWSYQTRAIVGVGSGPPDDVAWGGE